MTLVEQAEQGVVTSPSTAASCWSFCILRCKRATGIVTGVEALIAKWCLSHRQASFLYTNWDELCEIMAEYDVSFSSAMAWAV